MDFTIRNIFRGVSHVFSQHWRLFLSALAIPFAAMFIFNYFSIHANNFWLWLPITVVGLIIQGCIALITHRITLTPDVVPSLGLKTCGAKELHFLVYFVGIFGAFQLAAAFFVTIQAVAMYWVLLIIAIWVMSRISLCFPGISIGDQIDLKDAWKLTKPHQATMLMVVFFFPLIVWIAISIVMMFLPVATYLLEPIATVITIIALSLAYAQIKPEIFSAYPHNHAQR